MLQTVKLKKYCIVRCKLIRDVTGHLYMTLLTCKAGGTPKTIG